METRASLLEGGPLATRIKQDVKTEIEQMVRALEAGADEYIMKPFTRETLEDKLRLIGLMT